MTLPFPTRRSSDLEEARRGEMARVSGERFQCPPPLLAERFSFAAEAVRDSSTESEEMDQLVAGRERIGPVNLVAAEELARIEQEHGAKSEEHTSELQSLMRISYAVFCLKKK